MSIDRNMNDKDKNYAYGVTHMKRQRVPGDENDSKHCLFEFTKDVADQIGLVGFVDTSFAVFSPANNIAHDFYITQGMGFEEGYRMFLGASVSWLLPSYADSAQRSLHSVATQVGAGGMYDSTMDFTPTALVGKVLRVQRESDKIVLTYPIVSNTASYLGVTGNPSADGVAEGSSYCIVPENVSVDRTDLVCINVWLGDAGSAEDSDLLHPIIQSQEAMTRKKVRFALTVVTDVDDVDPASDLPASYIDSNGDAHTFVELAALDRTAGDDTISSGDITNLRLAALKLSDFLMLDCSNSPLTGDLRMLENLSIDRDFTLGGDMHIGDGDINGDSVNIDFALGIITANEFEGSIEGSLADMTNIAADSFYVGGFTSTFAIIEEGDDSDLAVHLPLVTDKFLQVKVGYPRLDDHAATKKHVDDSIAGHSHSQYMESGGLTSMQAILTQAQAIALITSEHGSAVLPDSETFDWTHGLGTEFILCQVRSRLSSSDPWTDNTAKLYYEVIDDDTVAIGNASGAGIAGDNILAVAFSVPIVKQLTVEDGFSIDAMGDSSTTLVT